MKKVISLIKNGVTYQVGVLNDADVEKIRTDISSVSAETTANTNSISLINTALEGIYTKTETDTAISNAIGEIDKEIFVFADTLPTEDILTNKIYVVPTEGDTAETNSYTEWLYKDGTGWEKVGEFKADTDLSNIYTKSETYSKTEVDNLISNLDNVDL